MSGDRRFVILAGLATLLVACSGSGGQSTDAASAAGGAGGIAPGDGAPVSVSGIDAATGGVAYVRFCNNLIQPDGSALPHHLQLGDASWIATSNDCQPTQGTACAAVPAGDLSLKFGQPGHEVDEGTITLEAGQAYLFRGAVFSDAGTTTVSPVIIPLESRADCDSLDYPQSITRTTSWVPLASAHTDEFSFARPAGLVQTSNDTRDLVFETSDPRADLRRFELLYRGRYPAAQIPAASVLLGNLLTNEKLTPIGGIESAASYASAMVDTGREGNERMVRISLIRHYELPDEDLEQAAEIGGGGPPMVDLFELETAFRSTLTSVKLRLPFLMKSIAWGISAPPADVAAADVVGKWGSVTSSLSGGPTGSFTEMTFAGDGSYRLWSGYELCSAATSPCILLGTVTTTSYGRFVIDGGALILSPTRCEHATYDTRLLLEGTVKTCDQETPVTLRIAKSSQGRLMLGGLGLAPGWGNREKMVFPDRKDGPPGPWDVPFVDALSDKRPASAPTGTFNACGLMTEAEPNDIDTQAAPLTVGSTLTACIATQRDQDFYAVATPPGQTGGTFQVTVTSLDAGRFGVYVNSPTDRSVHVDTLTMLGLASHVLTWPASAGQAYHIQVGPELFTDLPGPSKYTISVVYQPAG